MPPEPVITPPRPPAPRVMDNYSSGVANAFRAKEKAFFGSTPFVPDTVTNLVSTRGWFKVDTYDNEGETHTVVFFYNKTTDEVFEVHGTIARRWLELVRNTALSIEDFPIADTRRFGADPRQDISYFTRYALRWDPGSNGVTLKYYTPWNPLSPSNPHEFDPAKKETLVGCSEEYPIASDTFFFANWKDENDLVKYNNSIKVRSVGMPTQILLHETAGFGNLAIPAAQHDGGTYFVPHFAINNLDESGRGTAIQFADTALLTFHGDETNARSVGIEFVNAPFENPPGSTPLGLATSARGVYFQSKLGLGLGKVHIPLEFSATQGDRFFELRVKRDKLVNFETLSTGIGKEKLKVATADGDDAVVKYVKSDKFEHLATLVVALATKLVRGIDELAKEEFWKPVVQADGKRYYLFEHGWIYDPDKPRPKKGERGDKYYCFDMRTPGIASHLLVGADHVDGGLQCLYLYLKFVRKVPVPRIIPLIVDLLTTGKAARLKLPAKVVLTQSGFSEPKKDVTLNLVNAVELDEELIGKAAKDS